MPKISIIIPVYNMERYLARCLDSVINQTLADIEIICVNDGSTDKSPEILQEYALKDARIIIVNQRNGGLSSARNSGMRIAKSEYIGFVDSDDWIEPETYATALNRMLEDREIDFVSWGCRIVPEESNMNCSQAIKYHSLRFSGRLELTDAILLDTPVTVYNKLWKREHISKNGLTFPEGMMFEDLSFFWTYVADCKYAYFLNRYFYHYLQRKNSIMGIASDKGYQTPFRLMSWEIIHNHYKKHHIKKKKLLETLFLGFYGAETKDSAQIAEIDRVAIALIQKYDLGIDVKDPRYMNYSFIEKIFSIKTSLDHSCKIICIFGIKIKKSRRRLK